MSIRIVDRQCHCERCTSRTKETYLITETCINCGSKWVAKYRKGDPAQYMAECPECGVSFCVRAGTTAEAKQMLAAVGDGGGDDV